MARSAAEPPRSERNLCRVRAVSADEEKPDVPEGADEQAPASDRVRRKPNFEALEAGEQTMSTWPGLKVRSAANIPAHRRWAFVVVPAIALLELGLHLSQTGPLASEAEWNTIAAEAKRERKADDVVVFAPTWYAPVERMHLRDALTMADQGHADVTRYARALEVAVGNESNPEVAAWPIVSDKVSGKLHVRVRQNPAQEPVLEDLLALADAGRVEVSVALPQPHTCSFQATARGRMRDGRDGWGTFIAAKHYSCPSSDVPSPLGVAMMADHSYAPRRCFLVPTALGGKSIDLRFQGVRFGKSLVVHHGIHAQSENIDRHGASVDLALSIDGEKADGTVVRREIGRDTHVDGQRWKEFRVDTGLFAGQTGDLVATIQSAQGDRPYCFEATTR
mgnify:FL=1